MPKWDWKHYWVTTWTLMFVGYLFVYHGFFITGLLLAFIGIYILTYLALYLVWYIFYRRNKRKKNK